MKADLNEKMQKNINEKNYERSLKPYIKIYRKIIKFDDTEIKKYKFNQNKIDDLTNHKVINKIVVANKLPFRK